MTRPSDYPETSELANRAYEASGCRTHEEFAAFLGGVGLRSVRRWLLGECPLGALPRMVLTNVAEGWKPQR